ncbi:outer membrane protein [Nioella sp. MMSF_3534]|uniref:outer membrane protein n=1 Tax=Nioella sp. MMSF_3534 TaxID=3046720 RepID=UPI00273F8ADF|nr:outer membrane beta-barrel protein [Nioella sp. MMSF_3534]
MPRLHSALAASAAMATLVAALPAAADGPSPQVSPTVYEPAPVQQVSNDFWSGLFIGGALGIGISQHQYSGNFDSVDRLEFSHDLGEHGGLASIQIGYTFAMSERTYVGATFDYTIFDVNANSHMQYLVGGQQVTIDQEITPESMMTIGGRVGVLANENTQFYGMLGWSRASFGESHNYNGGGVLTGLASTASGSYEVDGATIGIGMETRLGDRTSLGVEYRYTDLGDQTIFSSNVGGIYSTQTSNAVQQVRVGLNMHF